MIKRLVSKKIKELAKKYPIVSLTGPRQAGKTTLLKQLFPKHVYVTLENLEEREFARQDPKGFLMSHKTTGMFIDEAQHVPELFSYIQGIVDESQKMGQFILSGSQNFLLLEKINQSLAGRVAIFKLLPFGLSEIKKTDYFTDDLDLLLFQGMYPPVYARQLNPKDWYLDYVSTYVERDIRMMEHVKDLSLFQKFMKLCSGRVGQLVNVSSLADECGIDSRTVTKWLSVLEASYLIFFLEPFHKNFHKRVVKQKKIFFYDTGLLCHLLGLRSHEELKSHYLRGHIYESFIVAELCKYQMATERTCDAYFWRDHHGHEVDVIFPKKNKFVAVEIKSGMTVKDDFFKGIEFWKNMIGSQSLKNYVVYGGDRAQTRKGVHVISWRDSEKIFSSLL